MVAILAKYRALNAFASDNQHLVGEVGITHDLVAHSESIIGGRCIIPQFDEHSMSLVSHVCLLPKMGICIILALLNFLANTIENTVQ